MPQDKSDTEKAPTETGDRVKPLSSSPCYMDEFPEYFGLPGKAEKPAGKPCDAPESNDQPPNPDRE